MASSSSSSLGKSFKYDVFLSFSGVDVRRNFIDHLYEALKRHGIHTFKDDEKLSKGKAIKDELLKSIENSKLCIIVFSKKYAASSWCLDELVKIMECQKEDEQTAYPVFYDVDPSEIRKQSGSVAEAFALHMNKNELEVTKWRDALKEAANLSGWDLRNTADGHEARVIKLIVEQVSLELRSLNVNVDENLVGMKERMQDLDLHLKIGFDDVRMIGIKGMGGAGKTTLARAIYDQLSIQFDATSFVENVREVSKASLSGLLSLQRQILSDLLRDHDIKISSVHDGKNMMKNKLFGRKVLVVLDDVDHKDQLEALAGENNWFEPGSRIIITTRDEQVLLAHQVRYICDVNLLSDEEAIRLFSRYAFGKDVICQDYEKQTREVIRYAAGLPLTIKVLGSFLCGKDESEWIDVLERLETIPLKETLQKLELSYESLEDDYKEIFLNVACILKGWLKDMAISMLKGCGFHGRIGLRVLEQKSLITIFSDHGSWKISMHDQIEEMGKNIVRRLHLDDPSSHSRLWVQEEVEDVLANDLGTEATSYVDLKLTPGIVLEGLGNMKKLRCLIVNYRRNDNDDDDNENNKYAECLKIDEVCQYFPNGLKYMYWNNYPHWCLPKSFRATNLAALELHNSGIKQLWEGGKVMKKLKTLGLHSTKLKTLDLHLTPNLESLDLKGCSDLTELHVPVGCRKSLVSLQLQGCTSLKSLSFIKQLESLEDLCLAQMGLTEFPDIIPSHPNNNLLWLDMAANQNIEKIPSSIENLRKLVSVDLSGSDLTSLPRSFCSLQHLKVLRLDFTGIVELPEEFCQLECLQMLSLEYSAIGHFSDGFCKLKRLKALMLRSAGNIEKLPENIGQLESLEVLDLTRCRIRNIPRSIGMLKHLTYLGLERCKKLQELPDEVGELECLQELDVEYSGIRRLPHSIHLIKGLNITGYHESSSGSSYYSTDDSD